MEIQWACLEEIYILVSWNKGLERVRQGVVRQVRECIKKEYATSTAVSPVQQKC